MNSLKAKLISALIIDESNDTIFSKMDVKKYPRSLILWDLIRLLNYAQLGVKYQEIERNDWLNIAKKLELTIEEILPLDMFDNEQQTTLMLFREKEFYLSICLMRKNVW